MKNEYDLLNSVNIDFSEYEIEEVSEFEKKKLIKQFRKEKIKKSVWYKKKSIVCIVVLVLSIVSFSGYGEKALAAVNTLKYNINTWLGINNDEYSNQIGKTLKVKDTILTVEEFFISDSRIIININSNKNYNDNENLDDLNDMLEKLVPDVYVDGKKIERTSDYLGCRVGEYDKSNKNGDVIIEIDCNSLVLNDKNNVKLVFSRLAKEVNVNESQLTYSFEYDSTAYRNNSKDISVDKSIIIDDYKLYIENVSIRPDKVSISGSSEGFSPWSEKDSLNYYYDVVDQNGDLMPLKEEIGQGAYFYRNDENNDLKTISIIPYTFNKINTNTTYVLKDGRTIYIVGDKIIKINLEEN